MAVTSKLGMYLPVGADIVDVRAHVQNQLVAIDGGIDAEVCSSAARPASPYTGKVIYEFNTKQMLYWNGASWIYLAGNNGPGGRVGFSSSNGSLSANTGNAIGPYLPITFPVVPGSTYVFHVNVGVESPGITEAFTDLRIAPGKTVGFPDPVICTFGSDVENTVNWVTYQSYVASWTATGSQAGEYTAGLFLAKPAGTAGATVSYSANTYNLMAIEDIG